MSYLFITIFFIPLVSSFTWENCGNSSDPIQLSLVEVKQNTTSILNVKFYGNLTIDVAAPIKVDFTVFKKSIIGWWYVPCVDYIGSCSFKDICALSPFKDECPPELKEQNLPCYCPVSKGSYAGTLPVDIKKSGVPFWLESGSYRVKATISSNNIRLSCVKFDIKLK